MLGVCLGLFAQQRDDTTRPPDIVGKITKVSADGTTIGFGTGKVLMVKVVSKTRLTSVNGNSSRSVTRLKFEVGQTARVWLQPDARDTAESLELRAK
jgi:hypothetical protein